MSEPTGAELAELRRRIDCPVSWCEGRWFDHGGDGSDPDEWYHEDGDGIDLPHGAFLGRSRVGSGPVSWSLVLPGARGAHVDYRASSEDPGDLARQLRDMADAIDAHARESA